MPRKKPQTAAELRTQMETTPAQSPTIPVGKAGAKVAVLCKLGVAWFELELSAPVKKWEATQNGQREITEYVRTNQIFRVHGTAYPSGQAPEGFGPKPKMIGGYAVTENCPKDFWDAWVEQHKMAPYVVNKMIFAVPDLSDAKAQAKETEGVMSGLEPVQRKGKTVTDPRVVKPARPDVSAVEESDRAA